MQYYYSIANDQEKTDSPILRRIQDSCIYARKQLLL